MAMIKQRGDKWQAAVRRKGYPSVFKTFPSKAEANAWATEVETDIRRGARVDHKEIRNTTVRSLLIKYDQEVCANKDANGRSESNRINAWLHEPWTRMSLEQDISAALRAWGRRREAEVKGSTHNRDLNLLSSIFSHAIKDWGMGFEHPIRGKLKRPKDAAGEHRTLVWSDADVQAVLDHCQFNDTRSPVSVIDFVPWVVVLLRHTGLRLGQLCATRMEWLRLDAGSAPEIAYPAGVVKNREKHTLPLSTRGLRWVAALAAHRAGEDMLIPFLPDSVGQAWRDDVRSALLETRPAMHDHHLHDLRHTWTTEMVDVRGVPLPQLMKISGRKSQSELMRYYNPSSDVLAPLMG